MSTLTRHNWYGTELHLTAEGGNRRQRAAAIRAAIRKQGLTLAAISYSETYGFQTATYALYRKVS